MTKPRRIQIDIGGIRERLEQIADKEKRSLASLCRVLIEEALEARAKSASERGFSVTASSQQKPVFQNPPSIAQLIQGWDLKQLAKVSRIKATRLEEIANGGRPTEQEIIYLGRHLRRPDGTLYQTEALMDIYDRDFPNNHTEGKPITNGA